MKKIVKVIITLSAILLFNPPAMAEQEKTVNREDNSFIIFDITVARPAGLAMVAVGAVLYTVTLPFSLPNGHASDARDKLLGKPVDFTFKRPLGEL